MEKILIEKINALEHWRDGNGNKGAAETIHDHEARLYNIELHHAKEEQLIIRSVKRAIKEHNKSAMGYIRAFAPYFGAIIALLIAWFE